MKNTIIHIDHQKIKNSKVFLNIRDRITTLVNKIERIALRFSSSSPHRRIWKIKRMNLIRNLIYWIWNLNKCFMTDVVVLSGCQAMIKLIFKNLYKIKTAIKIKIKIEGCKTQNNLSILARDFLHPNLILQIKIMVNLQPKM